MAHPLKMKILEGKITFSDFEYIVKLEDSYMLFIRFILIKKSEIINNE